MITLDLNLPTMDGMLVGREIRKVSSTVPIIMLTARDSESDQVIGLEMGADDYVTKPFSPLTLIARMKALHRRSELAEAREEAAVSDDHFDIETSHFKMNTKTREAYLDNRPIEGLTPKEFDLLFTLAKKPRQVFSREQLLELVWDYQYFGDERTVDAHIKKLRQKIEKVGPQVIQTVWESATNLMILVLPNALFVSATLSILRNGRVDLIDRRSFFYATDKTDD